MRLLKRSSFYQLVLILSAIFLFQACGDDPFSNNRQLDFSEAPEPYDLSQADTSYTTEDGVEIYIIEEGYSPFETISRDEISLYHTGRTSDGEIFNSSYRNGRIQPSLIHLSPVSKVIGGESHPPQVDGYREGLLGMKEGGKRVIIVPPSLGYNDNNPGINGFDLRDETLRYDVELADIR